MFESRLLNYALLAVGGWLVLPYLRPALGLAARGVAMVYREAVGVYDATTTELGRMTEEARQELSYTDEPLQKVSMPQRTSSGLILPSSD